MPDTLSDLEDGIDSGASNTTPNVPSTFSGLEGAWNAYKTNVGDSASTPDEFLRWWDGNKQSYQPGQVGGYDLGVLRAASSEGNSLAEDILDFWGFGVHDPNASGSGFAFINPTTGQNNPTGNADTDNEGVFSQLSTFLLGLLGNASRPNNITTIAPVTTTNVDNRVTSSTTFTDQSVNNYGIDAKDLGGILDNLFDRITNLVSVPRGGDTQLPNLVPVGYATNPEQSTQRQGVQSVASVSGLGSLLGGSAANKNSSKMVWLTIAVVLLTGYLVYRQVKRS